MTEQHEAARRYLALGWTPIPTRRGTKDGFLVKWAEYQHRRPTLEEVDGWWGRWPDANISLVLGNGMAVVDLDGQDAEEQLWNQGACFPDQAPRVKTGNGEHVYFTYDGAATQVVRFVGEGKVGCDFKANRSCVLAPPSLHPNGTTYRWVREPQPHGLPPLPGKVEDLVTAAAGRGVNGSGDGPGKARLGMGDNWVTDLLRCGVEEGARGEAAASLAGYFAKRGLPEDVAAELLTQFGDRCTPAIDEKSCRATAKSVYATHYRNNPAAKPESADRTLDDRAAPLWSHLYAAATLAERGTADFVTLPWEYMNDCLIGGFAPGELVMLGARPGAGKTVFGTQIAWHAAKVLQRSTLLISLEMPPEALAARVAAQQTSLSAADIRLGKVDANIIRRFADDSRRVPIRIAAGANTVGRIRELMDLIAQERRPVQFLVIDYLQYLRAGDAGKDRRFEVEEVVRDLAELAKGMHIPVLCLSSLRRVEAKDGIEKPPTLSSFRETGEIEHAASTCLLLYRSPDRTYLNIAKGRNCHLGTISLDFDPNHLLLTERANQVGAADEWSGFFASRGRGGGGRGPGAPRLWGSPPPEEVYEDVVG